MAETQTYIGTLYVQSCIKCGTMFGVEQALDARLRETHEGFYCPNGHRQAYVGKSEADKLRDRLAAAQAREDQLRARVSSLDEAAQHERLSARATRGHLTRIKNRVARGVCPCCNRTFADLARHMDTKHPDYAAESPTP